MPHVCFVALSGFRVREREMLALGMALPGLHERARAIGALPSLGLLTLAGLTPESWSMSHHEASSVDDMLVQRLVAERPTLVAISALTASIAEAYALADALRAAGVRVALGGLHVSALPDEAATHADAIVVGDGEPVWRQILADAESGALRPRDRAAAPFDLREAPLPRLDLLAGRERPRYTLQTQRGCPLACEFCAASRLLGPFREKPTELVERELDQIARLAGRPIVELADDNTFAGRRSPGELLGALERSGARWFTEADWRIGERPEVLERLAASGCVQVLVGIESMAARHAGMGAKGVALDRMMSAVGAIQDAGVSAIGCFIVGSDGEDCESMQRLADFLHDAPFADVQLTLQTPFPGTALRARLEREGRLLPDRGWDACTLFDVAFRPDRLSVQELESGFRSLVRHVFSAGPTARRVEIRRSVWARREGMVA